MFLGQRTIRLITHMSANFGYLQRYDQPKLKHEKIKLVPKNHTRRSHNFMITPTPSTASDEQTAPDPPPDSIDARVRPLKELAPNDPNDNAFILVCRIVNFLFFIYLFFSAADPPSYN